MPWPSSSSRRSSCVKLHYALTIIDDKPPERRRADQKITTHWSTVAEAITEPRKLVTSNSIIYICTRALQCILSFALPPSSLCCPMYLHTIHPTHPTSHHQSSHTVLIHSIQVSKPSQHSLIHSIHQLPFDSSFSTHPSIPTSLQLRHYTKYIKHFISRTFTYLLSAFLIPHATASNNKMRTITPSYRHFFSFTPIIYCLVHYSALNTL